MVDTSARFSALLLDACGKRHAALAVHDRCRFWAWILSHDNVVGDQAIAQAVPFPPLQDGLSLTTKAYDYHSGVIQHCLWFLGCTIRARIVIFSPQCSQIMGGRGGRGSGRVPLRGVNPEARLP